MGFTEERHDFEEELDSYYSSYPTDTSGVERIMDEVSAANPSWSPFRRKALVYETLSAHCGVKVFRHFPFCFELDTGRTRTDLGTGGAGGWLKRQPFGRDLEESCNAWWQPYRDSGFAQGWPVLEQHATWLKEWEAGRDLDLRVRPFFEGLGVRR